MTKEKKEPEGYCGYDLRDIKNKNDRPCCKRCDPDTGKCTAFVEYSRSHTSGRGSIGSGKVYKFKDHSCKGRDKSPYEPLNGLEDGYSQGEVKTPVESSKPLPIENRKSEKQEVKYKRNRSSEGNEFDVDDSDEYEGINYSQPENLKKLKIEFESYPAQILDLDMEFEVTYQQQLNEIEKFDHLQELMDINIQYDSLEIDLELGNLEIIAPDPIELEPLNLTDIDQLSLEVQYDMPECDQKYGNIEPLPPELYGHDPYNIQEPNHTTKDLIDMFDQYEDLEDFDNS